MFSANHKEIIIEDHWNNYLLNSLKIQTGFIFWHLIDYLQTNNHNTINIQEKLFPPQKRDLKIATKFWKLYLQSNKNAKCIYSNTLLDHHEISIDHFLPLELCST